MLAARALELLRELAAGLEVDAARMRANLEAGGGFVLSEAIMLALAPRLGRDAAHRLLLDLCARARTRGQTLFEAVRAEPAITHGLTSAQLDALLDYGAHAGHCAALVDRVLARAP